MLAENRPATDETVNHQSIARQIPWVALDPGNMPHDEPSPMDGLKLAVTASTSGGLALCNRP